MIRFNFINQFYRKDIKEHPIYLCQLNYLGMGRGSQLALLCIGCLAYVSDYVMVIANLRFANSNKKHYNLNLSSCPYCVFLCIMLCGYVFAFSTNSPYPVSLSLYWLFGVVSDYVMVIANLRFAI